MPPPRPEAPRRPLDGLRQPSEDHWGPRQSPLTPPLTALTSASAACDAIAPSHGWSIVDLFCGAGGLSEGFRQAGFRVVAGADSDPDAMATFALNFPEADATTGDLRDPQTHERAIAAARVATVLVGGPPCQAFSQVRNHSRVIDDPRNALYREFVGVLRDTLPPAFVMENVTGIDQMGVRDQISADLALDGEYVVRAQVIDAVDFGVPQSRKRLLFIGVRAERGTSIPIITGTGASEAIYLARRAEAEGTTYQVEVGQTVFSRDLARALHDPNDLSVTSVRDALSDLESLEVGNRVDALNYREISKVSSAYQREMRKGAPRELGNVQVPRMNEDTRLRLQGIPMGGNHRDLTAELLERYITGQRWGQDNGSGRLSRRHFYAYRRLHPDIWAWTLNTKADSVYHYGTPRALSVREFARLQSFPDRFVFTTDPTRGELPGRKSGGPAHSRYRQAGNAVPPLLARAVARTLAVALSTAELSVDSEARVAV